MLISQAKEYLGFKIKIIEIDKAPFTAEVSNGEKTFKVDDFSYYMFSFRLKALMANGAELDEDSKPLFFQVVMRYKDASKWRPPSELKPRYNYTKHLRKGDHEPIVRSSDREVNGNKRTDDGWKVDRAN